MNEARTNLRETLAQQVRAIKSKPSLSLLEHPTEFIAWMEGLRDVRESAASLIASSPELAELQAENERLRKDAERLDWVESRIVKNGAIEFVYEGPHETLRAAIDAAKGAGG